MKSVEQTDKAQAILVISLACVMIVVVTILAIGEYKLGYSDGKKAALEIRREEIAKVVEKAVVQKEVDCVMGVKK